MTTTTDQFTPAMVEVQRMIRESQELIASLYEADREREIEDLRQRVERLEVILARKEARRGKPKRSVPKKRATSRRSTRSGSSRRSTPSR